MVCFGIGITDIDSCIQISIKLFSIDSIISSAYSLTLIQTSAIPLGCEFWTNCNNHLGKMGRLVGKELSYLVYRNISENPVMGFPFVSIFGFCCGFLDAFQILKYDDRFICF